MEAFPSRKRTFIALIISGFLLYVIYGVNTRTGLFNSIKPTKGKGELVLNRTETRKQGDTSVVSQSDDVTRSGRPKNKFTNHKHVGNRFPDKKNSLKSQGKEQTNRGTTTDARIYSREGAERVRDNASRTQGTKSESTKSSQENSVNEIMDDRHSRKFLSDIGNQDLTEDTNVSESDKFLQRRKTKRLPNALIIGVKKGGTRALLEILRIHPDIRATGPEMHFFDRDKNYKKGIEWYRNQMPLSEPNQITIEKTPSYFVIKEVPERVYRMSKAVKMIVIVRDPTRRAISDYTQGLSKHPKNPSFEKMLLKYPNKIINEKWPKVRIGRYVEHYRRWLQHFPPEQFHFVSGEQLVRHPAAEMRSVEKFLNLRPFITENNFFFNKTKGFPCFVGKITSKGIKSEPHCLGAEKGRKHPQVPESILKLLQDYYRPFNKEFYRMVNRDFHWP